MWGRYFMIAADSIPRYLLEVYKTDEENFEPYEPRTSGDSKDTKEELEKAKKKKEKKEDDEEEEEDVEENEEGFTLHQGEILEIYYYSNLHSMGWDHDYEEMSNNGSCEIPYHETKLDQCYLGVRLCLRADWEEYNQDRVLKELPEAILGFITEERFNNGLTELSLSGMDKLMDKEYQFEFTQMKRSEIIIEMIKTAGLVPEVDPTGLQDDVIDYSNTSSSDDGADTDASGVSGDVAEAAKKACKGKKSARDKANAITAYICDHVQYPSPNYSDHQKCPSEVLKSGYSNCCDRARLGYQMAQVVKLKARGVHGPNHVWVQYYVDGAWHDSDPGYSRRSIDQVYQNMSMDSTWDFPSC